jgi:hypothetical protein
MFGERQNKKMRREKEGGKWRTVDGSGVSVGDGMDREWKVNRLIIIVHLSLTYQII